MIDNLEKKNNNINEIKSLITEIVDLKIDIQSKQSELQRYKKNIYSNNYPKSILKILKDKDFKIQQSKALLVDKEKKLNMLQNKYYISEEENQKNILFSSKLVLNSVNKDNKLLINNLIETIKKNNIYKYNKYNKIINNYKIIIKSVTNQYQKLIYKEYGNSHKINIINIKYNKKINSIFKDYITILHKINT